MEASTCGPNTEYAYSHQILFIFGCKLGSFCRLDKPNLYGFLTVFSSVGIVGLSTK